MGRENINEIAKLVKQHRLEKAYTQQQLSDIAGISLRSIQRIENAEVLPRLYTLKTLSTHLGFSINEDARATTQKPAAPPVLNRNQKIILSIGIALLVIVLGAAFIFQSRRFPETAFEMSLFIAGGMVVYIGVLLRIWR
jgi:transcriptional regulator with XRE-family HTH domain